LETRPRDDRRLARRAELLSELVAEWLAKHEPHDREPMLKSFVYAVERLVEREER
jgi:hypothetical protein